MNQFPLYFITLSLPTGNDEYLENYIKFYRRHSTQIALESGSREDHKHLHALTRLKSRDKTQVAESIDLPDEFIRHGLMICDASGDLEKKYSGYMQKEYRKLSTGYPYSYCTTYSNSQLDDHWAYYGALESVKKKRKDPKDSFDGTRLAQKIYETYNFKGYDQALFCVYEYARENEIDVKRPDVIANMMCQIRSMEKLKKLPEKKILAKNNQTTITDYII